MQNTRASQAAITTEQIQSVHTECTGVVTRLVGKKEEKKNNIVTPTTCISGTNHLYKTRTVGVK